MNTGHPGFQWELPLSPRLWFWKDGKYMYSASPDHTEWGKSRFMVLSTWNTKFILVYHLSIIVLFSKWTAETYFTPPCITQGGKNPAQTKDCITSELGYLATWSWDFESQTRDKRMNETVEFLVICLLIHLSHRILIEALLYDRHFSRCCWYR